MDVPLILLPHRVTVERSTGDGSEGPTWAAPVARVPVRLDGRIDVTSEGEHVSSIKLYARKGRAELLNVGARVTLESGASGRVTAAALHADGGLGGWEHVECTVVGGD